MNIRKKEEKNPLSLKDLFIRKVSESFHVPFLRNYREKHVRSNREISRFFVLIQDEIIKTKTLEYIFGAFKYTKKL